MKKAQLILVIITFKGQSYSLLCQWLPETKYSFFPILHPSPWAFQKMYLSFDTCLKTGLSGAHSTVSAVTLYQKNINWRTVALCEGGQGSIYDKILGQISRQGRLRTYKPFNVFDHYWARSLQEIIILKQSYQSLSRLTNNAKPFFWESINTVKLRAVDCLG